MLNCEPEPDPQLRIKMLAPAHQMIDDLLTLLAGELRLSACRPIPTTQ